MNIKECKAEIKANQKQINKLTKETIALYEKVVAIQMPQWEKKWLGKCFKYRNSYSGGAENDDERWWKYAKIIGVLSESQFRVQAFEDDKVGRIEFIEDRNLYSLEDWTPITEEEYDEARKSIIAKL